MGFYLHDGNLISEFRAIIQWSMNEKILFLLLFEKISV